MIACDRNGKWKPDGPSGAAPLARPLRAVAVWLAAAALGGCPPAVPAPPGEATAGARAAAPRSTAMAAAAVQAQADFEQLVEQAKRKVYPALVFIKPIREEYSGGEREMQQVFGSGVIIAPSGLVVTNDHVVKDAARIRCVLFDKEMVSAKIVGRDNDSDLAVLQLVPDRPDRTFPCAEFGDSDELVEGQHVMAMGSPYGFTRSVTLGIISNTRRHIEISSDSQYSYSLWLQTDAAINPGNSGGPLVDMEGKVIGINALMIWMANDLGFAIPSNTAKDIVERIRKDKEVKRAWTGIELQALKDFERDTILEADSGVLAADVKKDSPAEKAGLKQGDLILTLNDEPVHGTFVVDLPAIRRRLAYLPIGQPARLAVQRGAERLDLTLVPEPKSGAEGEDLECKRWNMTLKSISRFQHPRLAYYRFPGVFIQGVRRPGNAAAAGLSPGDILSTIDGKKVETLQDVEAVYKAVLADEKREKRVLFEVHNGRYRSWAVLNYEVDYDKINE